MATNPNVPYIPKPQDYVKITPAQQSSALSVAEQISTVSSLLTSQETPSTFNVFAFGAKGDLVSTNGTLSWTGNVVTLTGSTVVPTALDVGKNLVLPAGFDSGGLSWPGFTNIVSVPSPGIIVVGTTAAHPFTGITSQYNYQATPASFTLSGGTGYVTGDSVTLSSADMVRAATFTIATVHMTAGTIVNGGSIGPANATVTVTGMTGYGNRVELTGTTNGSGVLSGSLTLLTGGTYWHSPTSLAAEPVSAFPNQVVSPATWGNSSTTITCTTAGMVVGSYVSAPVAGIQTGTYVQTIPNAGTITITQATTAAATNQNIFVTANATPITGRYSCSANSNTIVTTGVTGGTIQVGMPISGATIIGSGSPTDAAATTVGTVGAGGTIILTSPSGNFATDAAALNAPFTINPMLQGATVSLTGAPLSVYCNDPGAGSTLATLPAAVTGGSGTGLTITAAATSLVPIRWATDDAPAINAATIAARRLDQFSSPSNNDPPINIIFPAANYGCFSPLNFSNFTTHGLQVQFNGSQIWSYATNGIGLDLFTARWPTFYGPLMVTSDFGLAPLVGIAGGATAQQQGNDWAFFNIRAIGPFGLAACYMINAEVSAHYGCIYQINSGKPWTGLFNGPYGFIFDGAYLFNGGTSACGGSYPNSTKVSSTFQPQTKTPNVATSFNRVEFYNSKVFSVSPGPCMFIGSLNTLRWHGYSPTFSGPNIVIMSGLSGGSGGSSDLNFDAAIEANSQDMFFFAGFNPGFSCPNLTVNNGADNQFTNSVFAGDYLGVYGPAMGALVLANYDLRFTSLPASVSLYDTGFLTHGAIQNSSGTLAVNGVLAPQQVTQLPGSFAGSVNLNGTISLSVDHLGAASSITTPNISIVGTLEATEVLALSVQIPGQIPIPAQNFQAGVRTGSVKVLGVSANATADADLTINGLIGYNSMANPLTSSGTLSNGGTLTLTATVDTNGGLVLPGPIEVVTNGTSIATATIVLPNETIITGQSLDGYVQALNFKGAIGAITWSSPNNWSIFGAPSSATTATIARLKMKNGSTTWYPG